MRYPKVQILVSPPNSAPSSKHPNLGMLSLGAFCIEIMTIIDFCKWFENSLSGIVNEKTPKVLLDVVKEIGNRTFCHLPSPTLFRETEKYINESSVCIENKMFVQDIFCDFGKLCLGYNVIFDDKSVIAVRDYGAVIDLETGRLYRKLEFLKEGVFQLSLEE